MNRQPNLPLDISEDHFNVLSLASLFEGEFSIDWIQELAELKASQILSALDEGIRRNYLATIPPDKFRFDNSEIRKMLQESIAPDERETLIRNIVCIIKKDLSAHTNGKIQEAVARHLLKSCNNDLEDCIWLLDAGDLYLKDFNYNEALLCYDKVIQDLRSREGVEAVRVFIDTAIKYSKISAVDPSHVLSVLKQAAERAGARHQARDMALLKMHMAKNEWFRSEYELAMKYFDEGWSLTNELDDPKLLRSATTFTSFFLYWQGRYRDVVRTYEKAVPDVEKYPKGGFPLLAVSLLGLSHAITGRVNEGLGMLDLLRSHCLETGDSSVAGNSAVAMGQVFIDIHKIDDAIRCLANAVDETIGWSKVLGVLALSWAHYLNQDHKKAIAYLNEFLRLSAETKVKISHVPYLMHLCWEIEKGRLPQIGDLSLEKEMADGIAGSNIFTKGVAYRYQALMQARNGVSHKEIIRSFNLSIEWIEESGHRIELAKTRLELGRLLLSTNAVEEGRQMIEMASSVLLSYGENLIPEDLRPWVKDLCVEENLLKEILRLGQEIVSIRDSKELVRQIISSANRITGAERGAIFLLDESTCPPKVLLRAAKNITFEDIEQESFKTSMKMINEVAETGKSRSLTTSPEENISLGFGASNKTVLSSVCVPMIIRNRVVGVLYHDSRFVLSAFKEEDLEILAYFAAQAAIALDNAKAYQEIRALNKRLAAEKQYYEKQHFEDLRYADFVGRSPEILRVLEDVDRVAGTDSTVLILGETGVGKELVARAIHQASPRSEGPFIRVHCSIFPENLISSELFGHEKGAFTGATERRIGRFELAHGGTLLLDEIGDIPSEVQVRLLRILQTKEFERIGSGETLRSDFRLVVATNRDLEKEVEDGRFREDLYFRINVFPIHVPPLRERKEDIPLLAHHFVKAYSAMMGKNIEQVPKPEMEKLLRYDWPGNVRELENVIERGIILGSEPYFCVPELNTKAPKRKHYKAGETLEENERSHIMRALEKAGGKVRGKAGAAAILGIHPNTLDSKMKRLGIKRSRSFSYE